MLLFLLLCGAPLLQQLGMWLAGTRSCAMPLSTDGARCWAAVLRYPPQPPLALLLACLAS
jgi:hypothetical protein